MAKGIQLKDKAGNKVYAAPYFPIGSIYLSINKTNPSTYFGGKWEQLYGGYLYAAQNSIGKTDFVGWNTQSGGGGTSGAYSGTSGSTTLTVNQIPSHTHTIYSNTQYESAPGVGHWGWDLHDGWCYGNEQNVTNGGGTRATGGGKGHTHSIPSHTHSTPNHSHNIATVDVFVWKRVA